MKLTEKFKVRINYQEVLERKLQSLHGVYAPFRSLLNKTKKHYYACIILNYITFYNFNRKFSACLVFENESID